MENKHNNLKVQLDFNITKKTHSLYHSFFNNPPDGVEYTKSEFVGVNEKSYSTLGKMYKKIIKIFPFVSKFHQNLNDILRKDSGADLIYFSMHSGKSNKPFVIDYEHAYNFIELNDRYNSKNKKYSIKRLNNKNLKKLLPINEESLKSFRLFFGDKVRKSQEVIYPTLFIPKEFRKVAKKEKIIISIGSSNITNDLAFYIKGGYETLKAFENLSKRYKNYKFVIISRFPKDINFNSKQKNLIIHDVLPQKELWEIMNKSLIFVQPNYHAPTMAYLEAMFFRLPIITYNCWANNEYVNEKNGILINPKELNHINEHNVPIYTEETINKIKESAEENSKKIEKEIINLINNPKLIKNMGENGFKEVTEGKFSLKNRNEKLLKIYKEILNDGL
ncbi:MAG TPA: glycosyltransferase [Caldisericia bacterium]|nr:glycosyltransferase [Caldisericia bacterium]